MMANRCDMSAATSLSACRTGTRLWPRGRICSTG